MCPVPDHHLINFPWLTRFEENQHVRILFELHGLVRVPENHKPIASTKVCIPEEEDYGINNCKIVCLYVESKRKGDQETSNIQSDLWIVGSDATRRWENEAGAAGGRWTGNGLCDIAQQFLFFQMKCYVKYVHCTMYILMNSCNVSASYFCELLLRRSIFLHTGKYRVK